MRLARYARHLAPLAVLAAAVLAIGPTTLAGSAGAALAPGQTVGDFELSDFNGKAHSLSQHRTGAGVVLIFVSTRCPVSNAYNERMIQLAAEYQPKGFQVLGINANKAEQVEEMGEHARKHGWNFPVLKDTGNVIADKLSATVTPEVFVIDTTGVLRYHGRIDDSQDPAGVKSQDLKAALDALLAKQEVAKKEAKAFGCTIKRV